MHCKAALTGTFVPVFSCVPSGNRSCRNWRSKRGFAITRAFAEHHQSHSLKIKLPDPGSSSLGMGGPAHDNWPKPRIYLSLGNSWPWFPESPPLLFRLIATMVWTPFQLRSAIPGAYVTLVHQRILLLLPMSESIPAVLVSHRKLS